MRFREVPFNTTSRSYREYWWSNQPVYDYDRQAMAIRTTKTQRMLDVVTPRFQTIRNNGGIICSPMYRAEVTNTVDQTLCWYHGHAGSYPFKGEYHFETGLGAAAETGYLQYGNTTSFNKALEEFADYESLAVTRAHADVDISEMQLLATVGELPETLDWIKSLITRAIRITRAFQSKAERAKILRTLLYSLEEVDGKKAIYHATRRYERFVQLLKNRAERKLLRQKHKNVTDDFSSLWLEYRYAIRPLIVDIQNALKVLDTVIKSRRLTARGREYAIGKWDESIEARQQLSVFTAVASVSVHTEESIKARAGCLYAVEESVASLATILGIDQPIESLYELIPFSFILDWFFSIGDLLQSWFKSSGLDILTSWVTCEIIRTETRSVKGFQFLGTNYYVVDSQGVNEFGSSFSSVKLKRRLPNPPLPLLPRFDLKLSLAKIIDLGLIGRALTGSELSEVTKRSIKHA